MNRKFKKKLVCDYVIEDVMPKKSMSSDESSWRVLICSTHFQDFSIALSKAWVLTPIFSSAECLREPIEIV